MSQEAVERTLGKLLTDECFRERFFTTPRVSALSSFSASLDPRISRLCPAIESSPEERQP